MKAIYEKAKYTVTKNVLIFTFLAMFLLTIVNVLTNGSNTFTASLGSIISLTVLIIVIKTKSFKVPAYFAISLGYLLNLYNLFGESNFENYIDLFWIMNLVLFAFFTLGRLIGNIYLTINILTLVFVSFSAKLGYIVLRPASRIYNTYSYIDFSLNLLICSLFFGYLINQFLKQANQAQNDAVKTNEKLKQSNNLLQTQYDEKSIMLKEIHHRVKNNLQVITSLLRLQLYKIEDDKAREPFDESISRINAMALIHEQMYKGDTVKNINLEKYIYELADDLISNYSQVKNISINVKSELETLDLNSVVPMSLILNELISNSLKHAFDNKKGVIDIKITRDKGKTNLIYKDNGTWKTPQNPNSFGLELIETFTEQLGGTFTTNHQKGTEYNFEFEVKQRG